MTACRYPGCLKPPTIREDADTSWCRTHARWEADRLLRQFVMQRDRHLCQRCGGNAHDAAHLIPRARAPFLHWQPANVTSLCRPCHQALDGSPAIRTVWVEATWPNLLEQLTAIQNRATRNGVHVDLGATIRDLRDPALSPADVARYESGAWLG